MPITTIGPIRPSAWPRPRACSGRTALPRDNRLPGPAQEQDDLPGGQLRAGVIEPPAAVPPGGAAVEFEVRVPPSGELTLVPGKQRTPVNQGLAGGTLTVWADLRSVHLLLDGHMLRTVASRLLPPISPRWPCAAPGRQARRLLVPRCCAATAHRSRGPGWPSRSTARSSATVTS